MDAGLALMTENVPKSVTARVRRTVVAAAITATLLGGCASGDTGASEPWDPIETPNRFMFAINRTRARRLPRDVVIAVNSLRLSGWYKNGSISLMR